MEGSKAGTQKYSTRRAEARNAKKREWKDMSGKKRRNIGKMRLREAWTLLGLLTVSSVQSFRSFSQSFFVFINFFKVFCF